MEQLTIGLDTISLDCVIGAIEEERKEKQRIKIDIEITYNGNEAVLTDSVDKAVDYRDLVKTCLEIGEKKYFLLETFAHNLTEKLLDSFPISRVKVKVIKKAYKLPAKTSYVVIEKKNESTCHGGK